MSKLVFQYLILLDLVSVWIHGAFLHLRFFFFSSRVFCFLRQITLFITVHRTHSHFIQEKKILKMGFMVLFTHLKIILLQCFQFSVLTKISCIQTDP